MDIREIIPEIKEMFDEVRKLQGEWDGGCSRTDCYWNLWHPTMAGGVYNDEESKVCVSESLVDLKMTPNTDLCKGYWIR